MSFYIQSDYDGRERTAITFSYERDDLSYSAVEEWKGQPIVGSVEFVERVLNKTFLPNYYPDFLNGFLHREVWWSDCPPSEFIGYECVFLKPADRHKRFDGRICHYSEFEYAPLYEYQVGPYWYSEIAIFTNEWRYYVANREVLAAHWYSGHNEDEPAPSIEVDWPSDFCGAVDFGICDNKITLVENHLPYGCGWYGSLNDGKIYGEWLEKGFEFLKKKL